MVGNFPKNVRWARGHEPKLSGSIGKFPKKIDLWISFITKFHKKLTGLKQMGTAMARRIIILKAVMESIPVYWLNLYKIPSQVIKRIGKIRRDFL